MFGIGIRTDTVTDRDAEKELFSHNKPKHGSGIAGFIKKHLAREKFLYAAVGSNQDEDDEEDEEDVEDAESEELEEHEEHEKNESKLRPLLQCRPLLSKKEIPIKNLPVLALRHKTETFNLGYLFPPSKLMKNGKPIKTYIMIKEAIIIYGPVISSDTEFTNVRVCIVDSRLSGNKVVKSYALSANVMSKTSMHLSYSFPRDEAHMISLKLSREDDFVEPMSQWGAAKVEVCLVETGFPM